MQSPYRLRWIATAALLTLVMAACGSSSSKGSGTTPTTVASGSQSGATTTTAAATSATTAASTVTKLMTPLCDILDASAVVAVLGSGAGTCQNYANEDTAGRCLWGKLGQANNSVQLTAFTGTLLAQRKIGWQVGFPKVSGVGNGAWSRGPLKIGAISNVVLYVDYGSFGLELAVSSPTATTADAVKIAQAVK